MDNQRTNPITSTDDTHSPHRTVIAGKYSVDLARPLGTGGMAIVYRGRDSRTRRDVALKTLLPQYRDDQATRERFRHEMRTMAMLKHPNVARVFDFVEVEGAPWAVLEYVPGRSLKEIVAQDGPLPVGDVGFLIDQVADALSHLHERRLVHLDVKPQNLIITPEGLVKLIDFGLAQPAGSVQERIGGTAFGTAAYLSPEQAAGEPIEPAADVYMLGCVVYELLTGRTPFHELEDADSEELVRAHMIQRPLPPSAARPDLHLPEWVDRVVMQALAKDPGDRFRTAGVFAAAYLKGDGTPGSGSATVPIMPMSWDHAATGYHDETDTGRFVPHSTGVARRAGSGAYRLGGRAARRTERFRRMLWRLMFMFVIANVLLFGLLVVADGRVPGINIRPDSLASGIKARATIEGLRVRAAPGTNGPLVATMRIGDTVRLTGRPTMVGSEPWWPVEVNLDGIATDGYVWGGGLEPAASGISGKIEYYADRIRQLPQTAEDRFNEFLGNGN